jgi:hypothetical protein
MQTASSAERRTTVALGAMLIVIGVAFLVGQQLDVDWERVGWPVFVIVPGLVLFALAVAVGGRGGAGFAVPAGIVTMTGLVLAVQNATDLWATWAYAWALVAPGGVGVGLVAYGIVTRQAEFVSGGAWALLVGVGLFLGFAFFFESIIHLSGDQLTGLDTVFAAGLVLLGAVVVALSLTRRRPSLPE